MENALKNFRNVVRNFVPDLLYESMPCPVAHLRHVFSSPTTADEWVQLEVRLSELCLRYTFTKLGQMPKYQSVIDYLRDRRIFQRLFWHEGLMSVAEMEQELAQQMDRWAHLATRASD